VANVRAARVIVAGLLVLGSGATQAQLLYSCTSADGRRIDGDRPPPECANRQIRVRRADGTPYGTIEPPLTLEQLKKRDDEAKRKILEADAARAQLQSDRSLLETYGSIDEIVPQIKRFEQASDVRTVDDQRHLRRGTVGITDAKFAKYSREPRPHFLLIAPGDDAAGMVVVGKLSRQVEECGSAKIVRCHGKSSGLWRTWRRGQRSINLQPPTGPRP